MNINKPSNIDINKDYDFDETWNQREGLIGKVNRWINKHDRTLEVIVKSSKGEGGKGEELAKEMRVLSKLADCDYVVRLVGYDGKEDAPSLVLELVNGDPLRPEMHLLTKLFAIRQIAEMLVYSHGKGITYNDYKVPHFILTRNNNQINIKTIDWHIAFEGSSESDKQNDLKKLGDFLFNEVLFQPRQARDIMAKGNWFIKNYVVQDQDGNPLTFNENIQRFKKYADQYGQDIYELCSFVAQLLHAGKGGFSDAAQMKEEADNLFKEQQKKAWKAAGEYPDEIMRNTQEKLRNLDTTLSISQLQEQLKSENQRLRKIEGINPVWESLPALHEYKNKISTTFDTRNNELKQAVTSVNNALETASNENYLAKLKDLMQSINENLAEIRKRSQEEKELPVLEQRAKEFDRRLEALNQLENKITSPPLIQTSPGSTEPPSQEIEKLLIDCATSLTQGKLGDFVTKTNTLGQELKKIQPDSLVYEMAIKLGAKYEEIRTVIASVQDECGKLNYKQAVNKYNPLEGIITALTIFKKSLKELNQVQEKLFPGRMPWDRVKRELSDIASNCKKVNQQFTQAVKLALKGGPDKFNDRKKSIGGKLSPISSLFDDTMSKENGLADRWGFISQNEKLRKWKTTFSELSEELAEGHLHNVHGKLEAEKDIKMSPFSDCSQLLKDYPDKNKWFEEPIERKETKKTAIQPSYNVFKNVRTKLQLGKRTVFVIGGSIASIALVVFIVILLSNLISGPNCEKYPDKCVQTYLSKPQDKTKVWDNGLVFTWQKVARATGYTLEILVDKRKSMVTYKNLKEAKFTIKPGELSLEEGKEYFWRVLALIGDGEGKWSERRSFIYKGPEPKITLLGPSEADLWDKQLRFRWQKVSEASAYELKILDNKLNPIDQPIKQNFIKEQDEIQYRPQAPEFNLKKDREYFWAVRAQLGEVWGKWTEPRWFFYLGAFPKPEKLIKPEPGDLWGEEVVFQWEQVTRAMTYTLQILDNMQNPIKSTTQSSSQYRIKANELNLERDKTYFWHVAVNMDGITGDPSPLASFTYKGTVPKTILKNPESNHVFWGDNLAFSWQGVPRATYEFKISEKSNQPIENLKKPEFNLSPAQFNLDTGKRYTWQVQTTIGSSSGQWSEPRYFTYKGTVPRVETLTNPKSEQNLWVKDVDDELVFEWEKEPVATVYILQILDNALTTVREGTTKSNDPQYRVKANELNLVKDRTYRWQVKVKIGEIEGSPSSRSTFVYKGPVSVPNLKTPSAGDAFKPGNIVFAWDPVGGAKYNLEIRVENNNQVILQKEKLDDAKFDGKTSDLKLEIGGMYFWRVQAVIAGVPGLWSEERPFISLTAPKTETPKKEGDLEAVVFGSQVTFKWQKIADTVTYDVKILEENKPLKELPGISVPPLTKPATDLGLRRGTKYSWQVRAKKGLVEGGWSSVESFYYIGGRLVFSEKQDDGKWRLLESSENGFKELVDKGLNVRIVSDLQDGSSAGYGLQKRQSISSDEYIETKIVERPGDKSYWYISFIRETTIFLYSTYQEIGGVAFFDQK